jgi:aspartyl-tRNA(Asn)/glutamyl-tRNA(Gln) amidotransferase subunit B
MDLMEFLETSLPELPDDARERLQTDYELTSYLANVITSDPPAIHMFDEAVAEATRQTGGDSATKGMPEAVANLLCNELFALVREHETTTALEDEEGGEASVKYSAVSSKQLGTVVAILSEGTISNTMAKQLLRILYTEERGKDSREVAGERGFRLITDADELASICRAVIGENPEEMERYKMGGKFAHKITKFLLGKAMQRSKMNAHPERLNEIMIEVLDEVAPNVEK